MAGYAALLAHWDDGRMMYRDDGNGWWVMGLVMLVAVIAAVVLIVWLVMRTAHPHGAAAPGDPNLRARQILAERLARGEIDPTEYQERLTHLS